MKYSRAENAWRATGVFYVVLLLVISVLDWVNNVFFLTYWLTQAGLITLGIGIFVVIGRKYRDLSAQRGVLLAFGIGVLTIIPGVLLTMDPPREFWSQYFTVGLSMAAGSFLGFLFIKLFNKLG